MSNPAAKVIKAYLRETGWTKLRLAEVCGVHHTALSHVLVGRRHPSLQLALQIVKGTETAKTSGLTTVEPIVLAVLAPKFAGMAPAPAAPTDPAASATS